MSVIPSGPLNWQTPIVDREGRPTPEFMRWFQEKYLNEKSLDDAIAAVAADLAALELSVADIQAAVDALETALADLAAEVADLAANSGGGILPVVDGSVPPVFIQNPDGSLVYGEII